VQGEHHKIFIAELNKRTFLNKPVTVDIQVSHIQPWTSWTVRFHILLGTWLCVQVFVCCPVLSLWWDSPSYKESYQISKGIIVSEVILNQNSPDW